VRLYCVMAPIKIVLFGDSLINRPWIEYNFRDKLNDHFHRDCIQWYNEGRNGNTIDDMKQRVKRDVIEKHHPDIVILFWDSDCSSNDWNPSQTELHETYKQDLKQVINELLESGSIKHVLVSGPALLGEIQRDLLRPSLRDKNPDAYVRFNQEVVNCLQAEGKSVTFIDIRKDIQDYFRLRPLSYNFTHTVTTDGEHFSERGTKHVANEFVKYIFPLVPPATYQKH